jgi:tRNA pseudouridine55 synthase
MTEGAACPRRPAGRGPDGVVLLDKPVGMSSNRALQRVRRLFGARKAGHTGSLDPLASGLLPICLEQATRFSGYLLDASKCYRVTAELGTRTATGDSEGQVVEHCQWRQLEQARLAAVLAGFRGRISQVPPMYSALKQGGERLYRKARRGETVARPPRQVEISRLELTAWHPPAFTLDVECSKGTYVRTLVEDIARAAGSCAHVAALRRYALGPYSESDMHTLDALETRAAESPARLAETLLPGDSALAALPALTLEPLDERQLRQGRAVAAMAGAPPGLVRLYGGSGFLGLGERGSDGLVRPKRLLDTSEVALRPDS